MHLLVACLHHRARGLDCGLKVHRPTLPGNFPMRKLFPREPLAVQFRFSHDSPKRRRRGLPFSFPPVSESAMPPQIQSRQPGFVLSAAQIFLQGIIGVEMLSGKLRNRCVYTEGTLWSVALQPTIARHRIVGAVGGASAISSARFGAQPSPAWPKRESRIGPTGNERAQLGIIGRQEQSPSGRFGALRERPCVLCCARRRNAMPSVTRSAAAAPAGGPNPFHMCAWPNRS